MFGKLLLLFIAVPLIELAVLMRVDDFLGIGGTIALVIGTGILGAALARRQGLRILAAVQEDLAAGRLPAPLVVDGLMILVAGALLLTPGLLTDAVGLLLLVPRVRVALRDFVRRKMDSRLRAGTIDVSFREL